MHSRAEFLCKTLHFAAFKENAGYGNVLQLGGVLVVKPGGKAKYQFTSLTMGHFPPVLEISRISE